MCVDGGGGVGSWRLRLNVLTVMVFYVLRPMLRDL